MTKSEAYQSMLNGNRIYHPNTFKFGEYLKIKNGDIYDEVGDRIGNNWDLYPETGWENCK